MVKCMSFLMALQGQPHKTFSICCVISVSFLRSFSFNDMKRMSLICRPQTGVKREELRYLAPTVSRSSPGAAVLDAASSICRQLVIWPHFQLTLSINFPKAFAAVPDLCISRPRLGMVIVVLGPACATHRISSKNRWKPAI